MILLVPARHDHHNNEGFYDKYYKDQHSTEMSTDTYPLVSKLCTEFGNQNITKYQVYWFGYIPSLSAA